VAPTFVPDLVPVVTTVAVAKASLAGAAQTGELINAKRTTKRYFMIGSSEGENLKRESGTVKKPGGKATLESPETAFSHDRPALIAPAAPLPPFATR
jgi:hypothetical protein